MNLKEFKQSNILVSLYIDEFGLSNEVELNNCLYSIAKQIRKVDLLIFVNGLKQEEVSKIEGIAKSPSLTVSKTNEEGNAEETVYTLEEGVQLNFKIVDDNVKTFPQLFNRGFNHAVSNEYDFYMVAEQDDTVAVNWVDYAHKYAGEEESVSVFLPIIRNNTNGVFVGVINEASWVEGMAEEAGITDINMLLKFNALNPLGAVFRVSDIKSSSEDTKLEDYYRPMKESIKVTHSYEFFLRMIYDDLKFRTIPRMGYETKTRNRDFFNQISSKVPTNLSSISEENGGMTQEEIQFYIDLAKKEYFLDDDRNLTYKGE